MRLAAFLAVFLSSCEITAPEPTEWRCICIQTCTGKEQSPKFYNICVAHKDLDDYLRYLRNGTCQNSPQSCCNCYCEGGTELCYVYPEE